MSFDEGLAQRIREWLDEQVGLSEKRMFGGLAFLVHGNMAVGVVKSELMVRVGPDAHAAALREPHARPMDFTKRPMKGFVFVSEDGCDGRRRARALDRAWRLLRGLAAGEVTAPGARYSSRLFVLSFATFSRMKAWISSAMPRMRSHSSL